MEKTVPVQCPEETGGFKTVYWPKKVLITGYATWPKNPKD